MAATPACEIPTKRSNTPNVHPIRFTSFWRTLYAAFTLQGFVLRPFPLFFPRNGLDLSGHGVIDVLQHSFPHEVIDA